jgi:hemoglobin
MTFTRRRLHAAVLLGALAACASPPPPPPVAEVPIEAPPPPTPIPPSLYARLGGKDGIAGILESFVSNAIADARLRKLFAKTRGPRLEHLRAMLADQICELSGGGCTYAGKSMKDAHARMKIAEDQFDAFIQDMSLALQERQIDKDSQKELLDKLAAMHDDVMLHAGSTPAGKGR